jgi:hypothetical protein
MKRVLFPSEPEGFVFRVLQQRDNFRFGQREYFRFYRLKYGFLRKEAGLEAKGFNHVEPGRA